MHPCHSGLCVTQMDLALQNGNSPFIQLVQNWKPQNPQPYPKTWNMRTYPKRLHGSWDYREHKTRSLFRNESYINGRRKRPRRSKPRRRCRRREGGFVAGRCSLKHGLPREGVPQKELGAFLFFPVEDVVCVCQLFFGSVFEASRRGKLCWL